MRLITIIALLTLLFPAVSNGEGKKPFNAGVRMSLNRTPAPGGFAWSSSLSLSGGKTLKDGMGLGSGGLAADLEGGLSLSLNGYSVDTERYAWAVPLTSSYKYRTVSNTLTTAMNAYMRSNLSGLGRFSPYLSAMCGLMISRNTIENKTYQNAGSVYDWNLNSGTVASDTSYALSGGFQLGANYFLTDSVSFNLQYERNIPLSSDVAPVSMINWGLQFWF